MTKDNDGYQAFASPSVCLTLEHYDQTTTTTTPEENENNIPRIGWEDVKTVSHLGNGAASNVFLVYCTSLEKRQNKKKQYALKCLDAQKLTTRKDFVSAAWDLAVEATMLSNLKHPNIVQLRGVSKTRLSDFYADGGNGSFILLEVLEETLKDRIRKWKREDSRRRLLQRGALLSKVFHCNSTKMMLAQSSKRHRHRMETVALSVASAMKYLHDNQIVYRDLKSENIGLDKEGNVQLFDFGMARRVEACLESELAGTLRYMAPEVMRRTSAHGFYSDVYSFGILLWEICTCSLPFRELNRSGVAEFVHEVANNGVRPPLEKVPLFGAATRQLIKECWDPDYTKRPSFEHIWKRLRNEIILNDPLLPISQEEKEGTTTKYPTLEQSYRTFQSSTSVTSEVFIQITASTA